MELRIQPYHIDPYPVGAVFIKGSNLVFWINEIRDMGLSLETISVYPIPGSEANSVFGCLVEFSKNIQDMDMGRNERFQTINGLFFIPERSKIFPNISNEELKKLLNNKKYFFHPQVGFTILPDPLKWEDCIELPRSIPVDINVPFDTVYIPTQIRSFQIIPVSLEETLRNLEEKSFPKQQRFKDKPLNLFEKAKLFFYRKMLKPGKSSSAVNPGSGVSRREGGFFTKAIDALRNTFSKKAGSVADKWEADLESLERRNQKELDKLLDIFKRDPKEALKYAIPIDNDGVTRGTDRGLFNLDKRWFDFSLFGSDRNFSGSGSAPFGDDGATRLMSQYRATADELIKQGDYLNAAFIYLRLLKHPYQAGVTLMNGKYYQEAASVFLKNNNKAMAAECYEKGNMTLEAIELYKQLSNNEKVGDLYMSIHKREEAHKHYKIVADEFINKKQYVKASLMYKNKMDDPMACQQVLLDGWRDHSDSVNCLNVYFSNIKDPKELGNALEKVYSDQVNVRNEEAFLSVLRNEYGKNNNNTDRVRDIAYEIIVRQAVDKPGIVSEIRSFNKKKDKELVKDTMRFKLNKRK